MDNLFDAALLLAETDEKNKQTSKRPNSTLTTLDIKIFLKVLGITFFVAALSLTETDEQTEETNNRQTNLWAKFNHTWYSNRCDKCKG